uniref:Cytochrome b-c1 complex subunit Rieske, mitochondrial n=1 Tax=Anoplophora glabripennis TaxID=217634 RepID=V5H0F7_ANOGL
MLERNAVLFRNLFDTYIHGRLRNKLNSSLPNLINKHICAAHTDIKVPDYTKYRKDSVKSPDVPTSCSEESRKIFTYMISGTTATLALYSLKSEVTRLVTYMSASADVLALAQIEIKLSDIPEGKSATFKWRGKPLFIRHRTAEEIAIVRAVPVNTLRDPEEDSKRCENLSWLIVIGVCTHLGCVPIADAGDYGPGGYYCPCHGSHYDAAGRIRKGPAPTNLVIPPLKFVGDDTLVVG